MDSRQIMISSPSGLDENNTGFDSQLDNYIKILKQKYSVSNRLLFINPFQFDSRIFDLNIAKRRGYYAYPPTGLLFLAASIMHLGIEAEILDLNYEVLKRVIEGDKFSQKLWQTLLLARLEKFKPSIIGVTCMFTNLKTSFEEVLGFLLNIDKFILLAGGTHVSFEYEKLLKSQLCRFAFTRESEDKLTYIMDRLLSLDADATPTAGVYYYNLERIMETKGTDVLPEANINIRNAYNLIPIEKYHQVGSLNQFSRIVGNGRAFSAISMNRGCRGNCTFCSVRALIGKKIRSRSIDNVIDELTYLVKEKDIEHFDWLDDDLLANRDNCLSLFDKMKAANLNLRWYANNGLIASSLDGALLRAMVDAGCMGFKIGIESGNEEMIKKTRKPTSLSKLLELSELFKNFPQLYIGGNYIIGFPNEKFSQMHDTFIFANRMNIDWSGFYICQPLKGTQDFNNFKRQKPDNYLPAREMEAIFHDKDDKVFKGLDIFKLNPGHLASYKQLKEVWFTFGFITNFINNKNLRPEGQVKKFINWVNAAMDVYPSDAGMALFLYLGYAIWGNKDKAGRYLQITKDLYKNSKYWQERFYQFGLAPALNAKQMDKNDVFKFLASLLDKIDSLYLGDVDVFKK